MHMVRANKTWNSFSISCKSLVSCDLWAMHFKIFGHFPLGSIYVRTNERTDVTKTYREEKTSKSNFRWFFICVLHGFFFFHSVFFFFFFCVLLKLQTKAMMRNYTSLSVAVGAAQIKMKTSEVMNKNPKWKSHTHTYTPKTGFI